MVSRKALAMAAAPLKFVAWPSEGRTSAIVSATPKQRKACSTKTAISMMRVRSRRMSPAATAMASAVAPVAEERL
ncbi:hypothetical protein D3C87_2081470 [compost metagenome]